MTRHGRVQVSWCVVSVLGVGLGACGTDEEDAAVAVADSGGWSVDATVKDASDVADAVKPVELDPVDVPTAPSDPGSLPDTPLAPDVAPVKDTMVAPDTSPDQGVVTDLGPDTSGLSAIQKCFKAVTVGGGTAGPDYDKFTPKVGTHCQGTNHQDIAGVEQVVFFGDSVTVGTPNLAHPLSTDNSHFFRNLVAEWLASKFKLDKGSLLDWGFWKSYDYVKGQGGKLESGAFKNCSKWGARTDDFLSGGGQMNQCFPTGGSDKKTLFVFTMGGNDIKSITEDGGKATDAEAEAGYPSVWAEAKEMITYLDETIAYIKDPKNFPKGAYVVYGNPFEYTDATGKVDSCLASGFVGLKAWKYQAQLEAIVLYILESYLEIAVKYQVDQIFMLEGFCGHGYVSANKTEPPPGACWIGPNQPLWFDETCIHPSVAGHAAIADMFQKVINE